MLFPSRLPRLLTALIAAIGVLASVALSAIPADATPGIENVWEFNGGKVAIKQSASDPGTYEGIVVQATTFAECPHPEGQRMWTDMRLQPDGSYFGEHQWYFENSGCRENPQLGPTAWRVFQDSKGDQYLEVCFSSPGSTQPTIAANGATSDVTYKCYESKLIAELPEGTGSQSTGSSGNGTTNSSPAATAGQAAFIQRLLKPPAAQCVSGRRFVIHLAEPYLDPFKTVSIKLRSKTLKTFRRGSYEDATIDLKGLPKGTFTIKITATTVLGLELAGSRTYHTCAAHPKRHKAGKLKSVK